MDRTRPEEGPLLVLTLSRGLRDFTVQMKAHVLPAVKEKLFQ
jgi:hypothetical protein